MFKIYFFIALLFQKKKKEEGANNAISSKFNWPRVHKIFKSHFQIHISLFLSVTLQFFESHLKFQPNNI